jgi:hypothetical protein
MEELLSAFAQTGYVVLPNALAPGEVRELRAACDAELDHLPLSHTRSRGASAPEIFHRSAAFDRLLHHPSVDPLCRRLIGPGMACVGMSVSERAPHPGAAVATPDGELHTQVRKTPSSESKLAQKLGQLQPFIAIYPHECMPPAACISWADPAAFPAGRSRSGIARTTAMPTAPRRTRSPCRACRC